MRFTKDKYFSNCYNIHRRPVGNWIDGEIQYLNKKWRLINMESSMFSASELEEIVKFMKTLRKDK